MKDVLILKDGTRIEFESSSSLSNIEVVSSTKEEMVSILDKMTNDNLKAIQIKHDEQIIANYENLVFVNVSFVEEAGGTIKSSFNLREKTETELIKEEVALLKAGYEIHDGAISELGIAVSKIAGGV